MIRFEHGKYDFNNNVDFCVGTGRMGLALQQNYLEQLALVQKEIGFQYIRGHGLFSDDMSIYHEYENEDGEIRIEYNFTYLDLVMDAYLQRNIRPFIELGFMPNALSSGEQTIFYWKGNTTPPKDYEKWQQLIQATLRHLIDRYGLEEVITWPIEVWNEPNLAGFWENADREEYFKLFKMSFLAIKEIDRRFQVGGPAICGVDDVSWLQDFLEYCQKEALAIDTVTRHLYTINNPEKQGRYSYVTLRNPIECVDELTTSREIIDSFNEFKHLPMHITEFNTSYSPDSPIHDTNQNAAYIAGLLAQLGETSASYSYWTFGDVFEEFGVPFTPFHGGFGLVANGNIPKPTFWTFVFFKKLKGACVYKGEDAIFVETKDGGFRGVIWNTSEQVLKKSILLPERNQSFFFMEKRVDQEVCNPLRVWHEMGEPSSLTTDQKELLRSAASPLILTKELSIEQTSIELPVLPHGVTYVECYPIKRKSDRGFNYQKINEVHIIHER